MIPLIYVRVNKLNSSSYLFICLFFYFQPSKFLQVATPESIHSSGNVTSPRTENSTSLSSKMKRMLSSPKVTRGKAPPSANKTFGMNF